MAAVIGVIITWLLNYFFGEENSDGNREGGLIQTIGDGVSAVGSKIWDYYTSDDVSMASKIATTLGAGYLIAPDLTSGIVSRATSAIADTAGDTADSVLGNLTTILKKYGIWIIGGLLAWKMLED